MPADRFRNLSSGKQPQRNPVCPHSRLLPAWPSPPTFPDYNTKSPLTCEIVQCRWRRRGSGPQPYPNGRSDDPRSEDSASVHDLALQRELLGTQVAAVRSLHIAVVGPACLAATYLPPNFKAPVVLAEELFTVLEAQLMRAVSAVERELKQCDGHALGGDRKEQKRVTP